MIFPRHSKAERGEWKLVWMKRKKERMKGRGCDGVCLEETEKTPGGDALLGLRSIRHVGRKPRVPSGVS